MTPDEINKFGAYYSQLIRIQSELKKGLSKDLQINKGVSRYFSTLQNSLESLRLIDFISVENKPIAKKLKKKFIKRFLWELNNTPSISQVKDLIGKINEQESPESLGKAVETGITPSSNLLAQSTSIIEAIKKSLPSMIMLLKELSKSKISSNEDKMLMGVLKKFLKAIVNKNTQDLVIDPKVKNPIDSLSK